MSVLTKWKPSAVNRSEQEQWRPSAQQWNPFREMERMQREMERLLAGTRGGQNREEETTAAEWAPPVDIYEDDKEFAIKAELPEVKKDDVKVTVEDGALCIRGERKCEKEEKNKRFHRVERSYGTFERSFTLPEDAETNKISSEFKDGVLTVHLPKNPNAKPKSIEVKVQ